jgi:hypothetical protein
MVEIFLLVMLLIGLAGWIALGVEDDRYWNQAKAAPRMSVPVQAVFWEDSLPRTRPLPWAEAATA